MADRMRWRHGDTAPMIVPVETETVIEIGDLLWLDGYYAKPASDFPLIVDFAKTQEEFKKKFLGVAMWRSRSGETEPIRIATRGVFWYGYIWSPMTIGDYCGPVIEMMKLCNQTLGKTDRSRAIGRSARVHIDEPSEKGNFLVEIFSNVCTGGV